MSNNEILIDNYSLLKKCVSFQMNKFSINRSNYDELLQFVSLIILEYDNEKLNDINNNKHMNAFITGILRNQLNSKTSPFYKKIIEFRKNSLSLDEIYTL